METGVRVRILTTARAHAETQPATSLPWRSTVENNTRTTGTCVTLSVAEMCSTELKIGAKNEITSNVNDVTKGTMIIMVLTTITPTDTVPQREGVMKGGQGFFP
jgi:hypothetical protein